MQRRSHGYRVRAVKRGIDLMVALPGVVVVCVLAPWVSLANRLTGDTGPVFFLDTRVGQRGRSFRILKFRTMDATVGPRITFRDDPRVTRVGRFLRRTKLDELPQLFNVLRGEMTVVGPRPESPEYVDWSNPIHRAVIDLKPGITGHPSSPICTKRSRSSTTCNTATSFFLESCSWIARTPSAPALGAT